ncbi:MAG: YraN family protein [Cellvibrionaceae bacterium]|nr:YraN family protein [Cellvibrionaceae bacterium]
MAFPNPLSIGRSGEHSAEKFLCAKGMQLVARNYRCAQGEIDLVMRDGDTLVFVEVRRRASTAYGSPLETVSTAKQRKLTAAAQHFLLSQKIPTRQALRFDVIGIVSGGAKETVDWIANAF